MGYRPEKFGVFCKKCGTYDVDIYVSEDEEVVFECQNKECDTEEIL
jgi:hypothetical protein